MQHQAFRRAQALTSILGRLWTRHRRDLLAALIVGAVIIMGGFGEVAFGGKTFDTSQIAAGVDACQPNARQCPLTGPANNDPRLDIYPSAWQLEPWAHVTAANLHAGRAPLWNPYESAGAPLAANMSSAALDPLLLPVNLHPTVLTWDIIFLLTLALNGIATFVLARVVGLRRFAASAAGVIYGLSGFFFREGNNAFFRVHLYMPLALLVIEWIFRRRGPLPVLACGLVVAGCVLVGMAEPSFVILTGAALYGLCRLFTGPRVDSRAWTFGRLAAGGGLGLMIAAPLLLPFAEYLGQAKTFKQGAGAVVDPPLGLLNWVAPKIQRGSRWTGTRNWVGAGALVAAVVAVASPSRLRRHCGWAFLAVAILITLKVYGAPIVSLVGHLPGAAQTLWPAWGTPEIALPIALLAGIGVESVSAGGPNLRLFAGLMVVSVVASGVFAIGHRDQLRLGLNGIGVGGWGLAVLVAAAVVTLVIWRHPRLAGALMVAVIVAELLVLTPRGFYSPRRNPYPRERWIEQLSARVRNPGNSRIFSTDGLLFPDTAGVYQLADPRVIDAIYVERYFRYFHTFVSAGTLDRWMATGPTEGFPAIFQNPMFDLLGARYVVEKRPLAAPDLNYQIVERVGDHVIYENTAALPRAFVVHDLHVVTDESGTVAYLKRGASKNLDGSVHPVMDPQTQAVVEASSTVLPARATAPACARGFADTATITHYDPSRIEITVDSPCGGLLVLSDTYFPGWSASVNARDSAIYPTDLAFRGVVVPPGRSTVSLRYHPSSFRDGIVIAIVGIAGFALVCLGLAVRRRPAGSRAATNGAVT